MEVVRSSSNRALKRLRAVSRGKDSEKILLEGERLVAEALRLGIEVELLAVAERVAEAGGRIAGEGESVTVIEDGLFDSVSGLKTSPGMIAVVRRPRRRNVEALTGSADALVVVAAGVQDPGNLGGLARTAEAAGALGLVVVAGGCGPWNAKALRGSMGSLLRMTVVEADDAGDVVEPLARSGFRQLVAQTRGGVSPGEADWTGRVALWVTGETGEAPAELAAAPHQAVSIPMAGEVESLNVAVAAAVLLFTARSLRS